MIAPADTRGIEVIHAWVRALKHRVDLCQYFSMLNFWLLSHQFPVNRDIQAKAITLYQREHPVMETSAILSPECFARMCARFSLWIWNKWIIQIAKKYRCFLLFIATPAEECRDKIARVFRAELQKSKIWNSHKLAGIPLTSHPLAARALSRMNFSITV